MNIPSKILWLEIVFFLVIPALGGLFTAVFGLPGILLCEFLFLFYCWQLFAFVQYRFCRQEEFLFVLKTAAETQAPIEGPLRAYLHDRPREHLFRSSLLMFVFPGYYFIHLQRSFDARLRRVADLLELGVPLDQAIRTVPGVVSPTTGLAITIGQFNGRLRHALNRLSDQRLTLQWLELLPRLAYPLLVLFVALGIVSFLILYIIPKQEKMLMEFKIGMPETTGYLILASHGIINYFWIVPVFWLLLLILFNALLFSSQARWHVPLVRWIYRLQARGEFLQMLGLMLEAGKPLPEVLHHAQESGLLPDAVAMRVQRLALSLNQGESLAQSLLRHELVTEPMRGLLVAAEKAQNLPWALQELGATLIQRSARLSQRMAMILFPLGIVACAGLVTFVALSIFQPLIAMMDSFNG